MVILLVIHNIGRGLATDVKFRWRGPRPFVALGRTEPDPGPAEALATGPLVNGVPELGPNSKRVTLCGQFAGIYAELERHGGAMPVIVEFVGGHKGFLGVRRRHRATFDLEVRSFRGTMDRQSDLH